MNYCTDLSNDYSLLFIFNLIKKKKNLCEKANSIQLMSVREFIDISFEPGESEINFACFLFSY